jgi:hypothetical protein
LDFEEVISHREILNAKALLEKPAIEEGGNGLNPQ